MIFRVVTKREGSSERKVLPVGHGEVYRVGAGEWRALLDIRFRLLGVKEFSPRPQVLLYHVSFSFGGVLYELLDYLVEKLLDRDVCLFRVGHVRSRVSKRETNSLDQGVEPLCRAVFDSVEIDSPELV
jgi:hypothetical protein